MKKNFNWFLLVVIVMLLVTISSALALSKGVVCNDVLHLNMSVSSNIDLCDEFFIMLTNVSSGSIIYNNTITQKFIYNYSNVVDLRVLENDVNDFVDDILDNRLKDFLSKDFYLLDKENLKLNMRNEIINSIKSDGLLDVKSVVEYKDERVDKLLLDVDVKVKSFVSKVDFDNLGIRLSALEQKAVSVSSNKSFVQQYGFFIVIGVVALLYYFKNKDKFTSKPVMPVASQSYHIPSVVQPKRSVKGEGGTRL